MALYTRGYQSQILLLTTQKILLGTWKKGPFADRITAPISTVSPPVEGGESPGNGAYMEAARNAALRLAGMRLGGSVLTEVARLTFTELDLAIEAKGMELKGAGQALISRVDCERVYVCRLNQHDSMDFDMGEQVVRTEEYAAEWFDLGEIPFDRMPKGELNWMS